MGTSVARRARAGAGSSRQPSNVPENTTWAQAAQASSSSSERSDRTQHRSRVGAPRWTRVPCRAVARARRCPQTRHGTKRASRTQTGAGRRGQPSAGTVESSTAVRTRPRARQAVLAHRTHDSGGVGAARWTGVPCGAVARAGRCVQASCRTIQPSSTSRARCRSAKTERPWSTLQRGGTGGPSGAPVTCSTRRFAAQRRRGT